MQNIQSIYGNPDLSDEQKVFGVYQQLAQNPTLANNLLTSLQKPRKTRDEEIGSKQFTKGYNAIYENDTDTLKDVLSNSETPLNVKKQLTDLKNKFDTRKSVEARELRNRQSLVQRSYKQAIEADRKKLDNVMNPHGKGKPEVDKINKRIKKLEALQKHDLKRLSQNPDSYATLSLWNNVDADYLPNGDEDEFMGMNEPMEQEAGQEKVMFDPNNKEHRAVAERLYKQHGDKEKVRELLRIEFEGI